MELVEKNGEVYTPAKPICTAMGVVNVSLFVGHHTTENERLKEGSSRRSRWLVTLPGALSMLFAGKFGRSTRPADRLAVRNAFLGQAETIEGTKAALTELFALQQAETEAVAG